jgi:hypothetical protein
MSPVGIAALSLGIAALALIYDRTRDRQSPNRAPSRHTTSVSADAATAPSRPGAWELHRKTGLVYQLTNTGDDAAADVDVVSTDSAVAFKLRNAPWRTIATGESAEFVLGAPIGDVPPVVTVTWTTADGEPDAVQLMLPVDDMPLLLAEPMLEFDPEPQRASAWFEPYDEPPLSEIRIPGSSSGDGVRDGDGPADGNDGRRTGTGRQPARHASR